MSKFTRLIARRKETPSWPTVGLCVCLCVCVCGTFRKLELQVQYLRGSRDHLSTIYSVQRERPAVS